MYDDVASSESNPFPGQLFNRPHGPDVYAGLQIVSAQAKRVHCAGGVCAHAWAGCRMQGWCGWRRGCGRWRRQPPAPPARPSLTLPPTPLQDYSHTAVTAETFLAVLAGNASGVPPPSRHSSGRVLAAGPNDKV